MPAMPIAESRAPIVVGISATNSAASTASVTPVLAKCAIGGRAAQTTTNTIERPASRIDNAISFGVRWRIAPSTSRIMRSRNVSPGSAVTRMTIRSESTRVPPVTELRSPPASRITGADSPVIADSSTEAMPSMISPSVGMTSPASQTTRSPLRISGAGVGTSTPFTSFRATVVLRVARSASACARPRPSASASAKFANSTVSHSQIAICTSNGTSPVPCTMSTTSCPLTSTVTTSTANMTGFLSSQRGSSLMKASISARRAIGHVNNDWDRIRRAFR